MCQDYMRYNPSVIETETLLDNYANAVAADDLPDIVSPNMHSCVSEYAG